MSCIIVGFFIRARFGNAGAQHIQSRIDLAFLALVQDDAKHFPHIFHGLEVVPFIAQDVRQLDDAPALQLLQAGADIGPGDVQGFGDLFRVERLRREIEQRMDLGHGAVDAPAGAHLTPMEDEFLLNWAELRHISFISVYSEITLI